MHSCKMQKEWLLPTKCPSGCLLTTLVKPQLTEPGQLRLDCICSLLVHVMWWRRLICLITHLSLKGYRHLVMGCLLLLLYIHSLADHLFCTEYLVHWWKHDGPFFSKVTQVTRWRLTGWTHSGCKQAAKSEQSAKTSCCVIELMPLSDLHISSGSKVVLCREMRGS